MVKLRANLLEALRSHLPQLSVFGIILGAVCIDYAYRMTPRNFHDRGYANLNGGKYDAAIADFNRSLRQNAADPAARFGLGFAYHYKRWIDEALKEYEAAGPRALEIAHFSYHNSGVLYMEKGDSGNAEAAYLKSLRANPVARNSLGNLAIIYESQGRYEPLLRAYRRFLEADPKNPEILFKTGGVAERLNNPKLAASYYHETLEVDPNFTAAKDRLRLLPGM